MVWWLSISLHVLASSLLWMALKGELKGCLRNDGIGLIWHDRVYRYIATHCSPLQTDHPYLQWDL